MFLDQRILLFFYQKSGEMGGYPSPTFAEIFIVKKSGESGGFPRPPPPVVSTLQIFWPEIINLDSINLDKYHVCQTNRQRGDIDTSPRESWKDKKTPF